MSKKPKQKSGGLKKGVVKRATKKGLRVRRMSKKRMRGGLSEEERQAAARYAAIITLTAADAALLTTILQNTTPQAQAAGRQAVQGAIDMADGTVRIATGATVVPALQFIGAMREFVLTEEGQGALQATIPAVVPASVVAIMRYGIIQPARNFVGLIRGTAENCLERLRLIRDHLMQRGIDLRNMNGVRDCIEIHNAILERLTQAYKVIIDEGDNAVQRGVRAAASAAERTANRLVIEQNIRADGRSEDSDASSVSSRDSMRSFVSIESNATVDSIATSVSSLRPLLDQVDQVSAQISVQGNPVAAAEAPVGVAAAEAAPFNPSQDLTGFDSQLSDGSQPRDSKRAKTDDGEL